MDPHSTSSTAQTSTYEPFPAVAPVNCTETRASSRHRSFSLQDNHDIQPPNGGTQAYLKVLGGFCAFFITYGIATTFGSYQAYYQVEKLSSYSPSTISWIGTTQVFLLGVVGIFSGALYDRGHPRLVLGSGMFLIVLGQMLLSVSQAYWHILLTQGFCTGIGSGLVYTPAVSIVAKQFTTKRTLALGVAATGSAIAGVILPIMVRRLLTSIGFAWTNRAIGLIVLSMATLGFILLTDIRISSLRKVFRRHRLHRDHDSREQANMQRTTSNAARSNRSTKRSRMALYLANISDRVYIFLCVGLFFVFLGFWVPYFYIIPFASSSLGMTSDYAFYLLSILNAGSLVGRVLPTFLDRVVGSAFLLLAGAVFLSVIVFAWLGVGNVPGITGWCFFIGFSTGIVVSMPNAVASRISDSTNFGFRIGFMGLAAAVAELIGAPIAGALQIKSDSPDGQSVSYLGGQIFGGATILLGSAFLVVPAWSVFKEDRTKASRAA